MDENGAWRELRRLSPAVPDARGDRGKRHKLSETLFLIVSGMPADCQDALDIVDFGRDHRDRLERFLEPEHGIPSHDTILRILAMVKPEAIEELVRSWTRALAAPGALTTDGFQVAFDGKAGRGSANRRSGESPVHIVSAYLTDAGFTLGSERVDDKSNEITAVPGLMRSLEPEGATVTVRGGAETRAVVVHHSPSCAAVSAGDRERGSRVRGALPAAGQGQPADASGRREGVGRRHRAASVAR